MERLVLLGDSVIDNGPYLQPGEADVAGQVRERLAAWDVDMRAVDGQRTADVAAGLARQPVAEGAARVLSVGGNDALSHMGLLSAFWPMRFAGALVRLRDIREDFRAGYGPLLDALKGGPTLVLTIYNPNFTGAQSAMQAPGEGGLSIFNDVIQQEALARGFAVLDLRRLFTAPEDYANPIEPSAVGGAKIADAVAKWAHRLA